jgi:membrane protease YdiL (CAAX protease family)
MPGLLSGAPAWRAALAPDGAWLLGAGALLLGLMLLRSSWDRAGGAGYLLDAVLAALAALLLLAAPATLAPLQQSVRQAPAFVLAALAAFAASVWATAPAPALFWRQLWGQLRASAPRRHLQVALWALAVACHEEVIWRLLCQSALRALLGAPLAVLLVALLFTWWHRRRTAGAPRLMAELGGFALLLGTAFAVTGDLLLVLLLHAMRNYFIGMNGRHEHR